MAAKRKTEEKKPSEKPRPKREPKAATSGTAKGGGDLGFERTLWQAADKLRNNMDAAEYKHVVLGLIFLKYISDAFEERRKQLLAQEDDGADPEDPDEYRAERVFWVPKAARWPGIQAKAKDPRIGQLIDAAMVAVEKDNPSLKGELPKNYGRPGLDKQRLGGLVDLLGTIGLGSKEHQSKDILGRVYEYFLSEFALSEGKKGGQFYTPRSVVRVLVEMLARYKGTSIAPRARCPRPGRGVPLANGSRLSPAAPPRKRTLHYGVGVYPWISPKVMTEIHADAADAFVTPGAIGNGTRLVPKGSTLGMVRGVGLDLLLPKLLSGELRIRDAERAVEAVA